MKPGAVALLSTVIGFAAGYAASQWASRHPAIPAPPAAVGSEVKSALANPGTEVPEADAEAIAKMKAEIETFRQKIAPMKDDFHARINAVLTEEQRKRLEEAKNNRPKSAANRPRLGDAGWAPTGIIFITASVNRIAEEAQLTAEQKEKIRELYIMQRTRFLALTDETPPPSLSLPIVLHTPTPAP